MIGTTFIIQDPTGTPSLLALYNLPFTPLHPLTTLELSELFPLGSVLLIREPYHKQPTIPSVTEGDVSFSLSSLDSSSRTAFIRVDCFSNIEMVEMKSDGVELRWADAARGVEEAVKQRRRVNVEEWKERGNAFLAKGECETQGETMKRKEKLD